MFKEILIAISTLLILSVVFNIYHARTVRHLSDELIKLKIVRAVEVDEFNIAIERSKVALQKLEEQKAKIVTKYISISTDNLASCEDRLRAIESLQKMFFEVQ